MRDDGRSVRPLRPTAELADRLPPETPAQALLSCLESLVQSYQDLGFRLAELAADVVSIQHDHPEWFDGQEKAAGG